MFLDADASLLLRSYTNAGALSGVAQVNRNLGRFEALGPMGLAQYTTATRPTAASAGAVILDTTSWKTFTSNGANWADQTGTVL